MKNKILTLLVILIIGINLNAQPWGPGGPNGNGGGPPTPPAGWCQTHPDDPACWSDPVAVPVGDWKWMLGTFLVGVGFVYYTMNKKMKKSNV